MNIRRKIALWVYPNLDPAIWVPALEAGAARSAISCENTLCIRQLDQMLTAHTGKALEWRDLKPAIGLPANVGNLGEGEAYDAIQVIRRTRPTAVPSCGEKAWFRALVIFNHVWPSDLPWPEYTPRLTMDGLEWPQGIDRPNPTKSEDAV